MFTRYTALIHRAWASPTLTTWMSLTVRLSSALIILPWVMRQYTPEEVAVWLLLSTIFGLLLMLDMGLAPTFSRLFAYTRGGASLDTIALISRADRPLSEASPNATQDDAPRIFGTLRWIYPRMALALVLLFAAAGTWALAGPIAQCPQPQQMWGAWAIVLVASYGSFLGNAYSTTLQGFNQVAAQRRLEVATGVAQVASCAAVLALGGPMWLMVAAHQAWLVLGGLFNRMLLRATCRHLWDAPRAFDAKVLQVMWPATWRSGVGVLMSHGLIQLSGVVYGQMVPARELASYLLALRVMTLISQVAQAPFYSRLPHLATLHAQGARAQLLALAGQGMARAQWLLVAGGLVVMLFSDSMLRWAGSQVPFVSTAVWKLMCLAYLVERLGAMHLQLYSLTNHIVWHIANGVTGLLMVAAVSLLYPHWGLISLPAGMLLAYAGFYAPYAARLSSRSFGLTLWRFEGRITLPALATLAIAAWLA